MRWLWNRREREQELNEEIEAHFQMAVQDRADAGESNRQASESAHREFGNIGLVKEVTREMWGWSSLEMLWQDVRYAFRLLRKSPAFTAAATLSLALGIGANTAIFQLLDAVRLRSLPIKNPQELAEVKIVGGNRGIGISGQYGELTRPIWEEIRRDHPAFSGVFAWSSRQVAIGEGSGFQLGNAIAVSGNFFQVLRIGPWRGRVLLPDDEHACPESMAVVSYAYWQSRMGGREIGADTKLLINGEPKTVVGVTPPRFYGLAVGERFDIALPFCRSKELSRNVFEVTVMGRLRPGWTLSGASAQLAAQSTGIMAATEIRGYNSRTVEMYRKFRLGASPASAGVSDLRRTYDSSLWLLLAITGLVLLIACANLANLMLARASTREREIAVRLALGAGRRRLLRQLLVESGLLAAVGAILGIGVAHLLSRILVISLSTQDNTVALSMGTDWRVLLFTAGVAALTCIVFGIAPSIMACSVDPVTTMKSGGRSITASGERLSLQRVMVVTQIAVSLVLLVGALLFVRSFHNLLTVNSGIRKEGITIAFIGFQRSNVPQERIEEFTRELLEDVRSVPGVLNAAITTHAPLIGGGWENGIHIGSTDGTSKFTWVSPGYFATMDIPLLAGRNFNENDTPRSQRVAIVNQTFVRRFLDSANPIGQTLHTSPEPKYPSTAYEIVGVIADTKYDSLRGDTPPMTFEPASQFPSQRPWTTMMIRSQLAPAVVIDSVKQRVASKHSEIFAQYRVFETQIRDRFVRERLMATLSGFFGLLAAVLVVVGLYGVISYVVIRRRNEIGIRIALGANRSQIVGMVMLEAGLLLIVGVVIGTALSLAAGRGANSLLFGLKSYDPLTLMTAIGLLAVIGAVASFLPARRASKLDPMMALRYE